MQASGVLAWDGARNLMDLGGLPTRDGGRTAFDRVWRSAATEWLTMTGWQAARAAGLTRIIDLRNDDERGRQELHPVISESALAGVTVICAPTEDSEDPGFLEECGPWLDHPRSWEPNARRYPDKFRHVFESLADSPGPVLIHCHAGRDRTGMIASMLLALANVEPEAIADFYERGFRGAGSHRGHGLGYDADSGQWRLADDREWAPDELTEALGDRRIALLQWLRGTDIVKYLREAGMHTRQVLKLQRMFD